MKTAARIVAAAALMAAFGAGAQPLQDPTRPPAALMAAGRGTTAAAALVDGPRLQSILIAPAPGGRHVAVIDGQTVRPGDSVNGWRIGHMTPTQVVLSKGGKKQVLKLFPAAAGQNAQPVQR